MLWLIASIWCVLLIAEACSIVFNTPPSINFVPLLSYQSLALLLYFFSGHVWSLFHLRTTILICLFPWLFPVNTCIFLILLFCFVQKLASIHSLLFTDTAYHLLFFCPKDRRVLFAYRKLAFPQGHPVTFAFLYSSLAKVSSLAVELGILSLKPSLFPRQSFRASTPMLRTVRATPIISSL